MDFRGPLSGRESPLVQRELLTEAVSKRLFRTNVMSLASGVRVRADERDDQASIASIKGLTPRILIIRFML